MPRPSSLPTGNTSHAFWSALQAAWTFHATGNSGAGCDPVKGGSVGTLTSGASRSDTVGLNDTTANAKCDLAATLSCGSGPYSLMWRSKNTTVNDGMVFGRAAAVGYMWMSEGTNTVRYNDGVNNISFTIAQSLKTTTVDYCLTAGAPSGGTHTIRLYSKLATDTTWTLAGSQVATSQNFTITNFGDGYGSALGFIGELHYFMQFNAELTAANLDASFADPYDILAASSSITLTAQSASTRVKIKKESGVYTVTVAGTYVGTPTSIEYRVGNGAWTTLVASPSGGTYSASVNIDGTVSAQGLAVRFSNLTSVTASDPLFTIADEIWVTDVDSISAGRLTNLQNHTGRTYTSLKYDTSNGWTECDDPTQLGSSLGSNWPILANLLADDRIVCFIPHGTSGALMTGVRANTGISALVTASGVTSITGVLMHGGANDISTSNATTNSANAWATECQAIATSIVAAYPGAVVSFAILGDVSSISGGSARATAVRRGTLQAIAASPSTCKLGANVWWRELATDHLHPVSDAEGLDYAREWWQQLRTGATSSPSFVSAFHNAAKTIVTVRFNQSLRTGTSITPACFQVYDDGVAKTISSASVSGDSVALTLSSACTGTITVSMGEGLTSYGTPPQGLAVTLPNSGGSFFPAAIPFFLQSVTSNYPTVSAASISTSGTTLVVSFTIPGTSPMLPVGGITGFALTASGGAISLPAGSRTSSTEMTFALSRTVLASEILTLAYASGNVSDSASNNLQDFTGFSVTNESTATAASGSVLQSVTFSPVMSW